LFAERLDHIVVRDRTEYSSNAIQEVNKV